MIAQLGLFFLFGATISSGQFMPRGQSSGCPSGPELAPLICKFMQQNIDLLYKPKLITSTTYIPPLVVEKCDSPKLEMEINLPATIEERKPVVIPAPPELPPIMIPKFPIPVIIEEPPASVSKPFKTDISETPVVNIPMAPELPTFEMPALPQIKKQLEPHIQIKPEIDYNVVECEPWVPQPLESPELTMPELLMMPKIVAPYPENESVAKVLLPEPIQPLAVVPAAPKLPPVQFPEFPIRIENPVEPMLPPIDISSTPMFIEHPVEEPCLNEITIPEIDNNLVEHRPISIPQPPELPAFLMPELPQIVMKQKVPIVAVPYHEDQPAPMINVPEYIKPLAPVPVAPELPAFVMPEFPIRVVEQELHAVPHIQPLAPIPAVPELPEFYVREEIPSGPILPPVDIFAPPMSIEYPVEVPCLNEVVIPDIDNNLVEYNPISVPQPPELPAFVMPELPKIVVEQELPIAALCPEDQPAPLVTIPEYIQPLAPVPAAPKLLPASLPEFPIHVKIPSGPVLPRMNIPSSPVLMPKTEEPCLTEELVLPQPEPIIIPQPPKLPKFEMPELPKFEPVTLPMPAFAAEPCESSGQPILKVTADTSPYYERYFPSKKLHKIMIPSQPIDPGFFPTRCVYNLVMEHVIPNIASDRFRSMDTVKALPPPDLPCS